MRHPIPVVAALTLACSLGTQPGPGQHRFLIPPGEVELAEGQAVEVGLPNAPSALFITFVRVSSDSRCPSNAQCVWAGEVSVVLTLGGVGSGDLILNLPATATKPSTGQVGPYRIELKEVTPYPVAGTPPQQPNRVTLGVSLQL